MRTRPRFAETQKQSQAELSDAELAAVSGGTEDVQQDMQLRMQMQMDRMSKADSSLSNLMKKMFSTSSGIIQNIK